MSSSVKSLLFILALPLLAAIVHDVYINYFSDDKKIQEARNLRVNPDDFLVSDTGWVWQYYHADSLIMLRESMDAEQWSKSVNPILKTPTMIIGMVPLGVGCVYLIIAFILGIWPFSKFRRKENPNDYAVYEHAKAKKIKFNRK